MTAPDGVDAFAARLADWMARPENDLNPGKRLTNWPRKDLLTKADHLDAEMEKALPRCGQCRCTGNPFDGWRCRSANPYRGEMTRRDDKRKAKGKQPKQPKQPEPSPEPSPEPPSTNVVQLYEPEAPAGPLPGTTDADGWPLGVLPTDWGDYGDAPKPTLLHAPDLGHGLFYEGGCNWLVGKPSTGKTWTALRVALGVVAEARRVLWIEGHGDRSYLNVRCEAMGCAEAVQGITHLTSTQWDQAEPEDRAAIWQWLGTGLLVVDSAGSTGAGESERSFNAWHPRYIPDPPPGADRPTVLILDHGPKRLVDGVRLEGGLGTVYKLAKADASLYLEGCLVVLHGDDTISPGAVRVIVDKGRHGLGQQGDHIANIETTVTAAGALDITATAPKSAPTPTSADYLPLIIEAVGDDPDIGAVALRDVVAEAAKTAGLRADWQTIAKAIQAAINGGHVVKTQGKANRTHHNLPGPHLGGWCFLLGGVAVSG